MARTGFFLAATIGNASSEAAFLCSMGQKTLACGTHPHLLVCAFYRTSSILQMQTGEVVTITGS